MAKITKNSVQIESRVYPHKVLKELVYNGDFYIANIEGNECTGYRKEGAVIVYGLLSSDSHLVQGFMVDSDGLLLPYNCLMTWAAYEDVWKHVDIEKFMEEFPYSEMDEIFSDFKQWLNKVVENSLYSKKGIELNKK